MVHLVPRDENECGVLPWGERTGRGTTTRPNAQGTAAFPAGEPEPGPATIGG